MLKWLKRFLWLVLIVVFVLFVLLFVGYTINFGIFKTISTSATDKNIATNFFGCLIQITDKNIATAIFDILRNTALGIGGIMALIYTQNRLEQTDKQIEHTKTQIEQNKENNNKQIEQTKKQIEQNEKTTLSNTYKNALEMLANQSASVQIAGIDILQQIAQENPNEYKAKIIKLLSQHVVVKSKNNFWQLVKRFKEKSKDANGNITQEKDFNESDFNSLQQLKEYANSINWYMYAEIQKAVDALFTIAVVDKDTLDIIHGTDTNKIKEAYQQLPVIDLRGARFTGEIYFNAINNTTIGKEYYNKHNLNNFVYYPINLDNVVFFYNIPTLTKNNIIVFILHGDKLLSKTTYVEEEINAWIHLCVLVRRINQYILATFGDINSILYDQIVTYTLNIFPFYMENGKAKVISCFMLCYEKAIEAIKMEDNDKDFNGYLDNKNFLRRYEDLEDNTFWLDFYNTERFIREIKFKEGYSSSRPEEKFNTITITMSLARFKDEVFLSELMKSTYENHPNINNFINSKKMKDLFGTVYSIVKIESGEKVLYEPGVKQRMVVESFINRIPKSLPPLAKK